MNIDVEVSYKVGLRVGKKLVKLGYLSSKRIIDEDAVGLAFSKVMRDVTLGKLKVIGDPPPIRFQTSEEALAKVWNDLADGKISFYHSES